MSVFSDNITNENTPLQKFYNLLKTVVKGEFNSLYRQFDGDLSRVSSVYNDALDKCQQNFAEYGMYHPWLLCTPVAGVNSSESKVLVTILYSGDPFIYIHDDRKIFLQITIPISQLKDII
jgi:hypothetical protein